MRGPYHLLVLRIALVGCMCATAAATRAFLSRRACVCGVGVLTAGQPNCARAEPTTELYTFDEKSLGIELASVGGLVRVEKVRPGSPAVAKGVAPFSTVLEVNGASTTGFTAEQVQALVRSASRPVTLRLDATSFRAQSAVEQTRLAASALGMQSDRIQIELLTGPQDPQCAYKTRESDVVEVDFSAAVLATGREFDSSEMRSGRPFAFMLGNGDVVRGLELGTLSMCIGEERRVLVPPPLGFGARGSRTYGVPPDAVLEYRVKLLSINMQTDPRTRRVDVDDEQRFSEDSESNVVNAAELEGSPR